VKEVIITHKDKTPQFPFVTLNPSCHFEVKMREWPIASTTPITEHKKLFTFRACPVRLLNPKRFKIINPLNLKVHEMLHNIVGKAFFF